MRRTDFFTKGIINMPQPNLERPIQMLFRVSERERDFIYKKMALAKTKNKAAYLRKMAIDGYILNVNYSEFKELFATMHEYEIRGVKFIVTASVKAGVKESAASKVRRLIRKEIENIS
jgi:hypothetical protein